RDVAGNAGPYSSPNRNFLVAAAFPGAVLQAPANASELITGPPLIDWGDVAGATAYWLKAASSTDFTTLTVSSNGMQASQYQTVIYKDDFKAATTYYWYVRATNGTDISYSHRWQFYVAVPTPSVPSPSSPADAAALPTAGPLLDWDDIVGISSFTVLISTRSDFAPLKLATSPTSSQYQVKAGDGLANSTTYWWKVRSATWSVNSDYTAGRWFFVDLTSPSAPSPSYPPDSRTTSDKTPSFMWGAVADLSGVTYTLEVSSDAGFTQLAQTLSGLTTTQATLADALARGSTYYWRVASIDGAGNRTNSSHRTLSVATNTTVYSYRLEISERGDYGELRVLKVLAATSYTLTAPEALACNTTYYWRVRAGDATGATGGAFSSPDKNFIYPGEEDMPLWVSPADASGATLNRRPKLWLVARKCGVADPSDARVAVSTSVDFEVGISTSFLYSGDGSGWSPAGPWTAGTTIYFTPPTDLTAQTTTLYLRAATRGDAWSSWSANRRVLVRGAFSWSGRAPIVPRATGLRAQDIAELRNAIDEARAFRNVASTCAFSAASWTEPVLTPRKSLVKAAHVAELRDNLSPVIECVLGYTPAFSDAVLTPASKVRAVHIDELRTEAAKP
ncbi:MAG: hypothetical protein HY554_19245, partial [Elusimicrobia bacterium]|nr:hypothetical protein [Elusimicrobiota bacterium]